MAVPVAGAVAVDSEVLAAAAAEAAALRAVGEY